MRSLSLSLLPVVLLAGCVGNVADYVGPRTGIVTDELTRYGLDASQAQCVSARMADGLTPYQLRRLVRVAASVTQGYYESDRLTARDFHYVASTMDDPAVVPVLDRSNEQCGVKTEVVAEAAPPAPASATAPTGTWLNLGAAPSGQAIAVDASTVERDASFRKAWFRLTNPGAVKPSDTSYLLRIDCAARTINAMAHRKQDAAGAVADYRDFGPAGEGVSPIEGGTVMEIAYLALCT